MNRPQESPGFSCGEEVNAHPVVIWWDTAGRPEPTKPGAHDGVCDLTGRHGTIWPAHRIVSGLFTAWDRLNVEPQRAGLSAAAWHVITTRSYRAHIHTTSPDIPVWELLDQPLRLDVAVAVSVGGQAHAAPWAINGHVTSEATSLRWDTTQATLWGHYQQIRVHVGRDAIEHPAPSYQALKPLNNATRAVVMGLWPHLDPWRRRPEHMAIAHRIHRDRRRAEKENDARAADHP